MPKGEFESESIGNFDRERPQVSSYRENREEALIESEL